VAESVKTVSVQGEAGISIPSHEDPCSIGNFAGNDNNDDAVFSAFAKKRMDLRAQKLERF